MVIFHRNVHRVIAVEAMIIDASLAPERDDICRADRVPAEAGNFAYYRQITVNQAPRGIMNRAAAIDCRARIGRRQGGEEEGACKCLRVLEMSSACAPALTRAEADILGALRPAIAVTHPRRGPTLCRTTVIKLAASITSRITLSLWSSAPWRRARSDRRLIYDIFGQYMHNTE